MKRLLFLLAACLFPLLLLSLLSLFEPVPETSYGLDTAWKR